jgi:cyclic-di-GMP phosphodiesterase TipF (flagellum assembly factor)
MQDGITMSAGQDASSRGLAMLDMIVLIAMAITAVAFAAGLTVQAGLPLLPVLIATAALFLVMAASYVMLGRAARGGGSRIEEIEAALEIIDNDLQRIDRVEDDVARLDLLSDRVERLDQALGGTGSPESLTRPVRAEEPATEFEGVYARTESLRAEIEAESRGDDTGAKVGLLESLLERRSSDLTPETSEAEPEEADTAWDAPSAPPVVEEEVEAEAEEEPEPIVETFAEMESESEIESEIKTGIETEIEIGTEIGTETEPQSETEPLETEVEAEIETEIEIEEEIVEEALAEPEDEAPLTTEEIDVVETVELVEGAETVEVVEEAVELAAAEPAAALLDDDDEDEDDAMRSTIRKAVETGRVEVYLQPTVTLPDRKVLYFEALTRVRTTEDDLVLPGDYIPVAKRAGMMPLIDNALLARSVQALRDLPEGSEVRGLFCNISLHSLLDPDYFPELVEFMEENNSLCDSLVFEVSQPEMKGLTEAEYGCLDTLGALGYSFCLDNVSDLDADFSALSDRYFRYVKISAEIFLGVPGRIVADLKRQLDGLGMQLIVEKVEDEGDVAKFLDHGIALAQGNLFDPPKPADEVLARDSEESGAA